MSRAQRHRDAETWWAQGDAALAAGDLEEAFRCLTGAHDRVTDTVAGHRAAHVKLLPVDEALGRTRDARVDRLLLALGPVGVWWLLAAGFRIFGRYERFEA